MYLFIFESIGTQELILIGVAALIFLGPRKMPEIARKIGKMMAEFRTTTSDFKQTWEREVNFEEEVKAFRIDDDEPAPVARVNSILDSTEAEGSTKNDGLQAPTIKEIDPATFDRSLTATEPVGEEAAPSDDENDKRNWL